MFARKLAPLATAAALGLLALGSASASATTLRADPGNAAFPTGGVTLTNTTSDPWTGTTPVGTFSCSAGKFTADVNNNHATVLTGRLTQLTFTSCTDTIPVINFTSCQLHAPSVPVVSMHANGTGGITTLSDLVLRCALAGTTSACYFTSATAVGTNVNATSSLNFSNIPAVGITPTTDALSTNLCFSSGTSQVTFTHIVQSGTNRTVTVTP